MIYLAKRENGTLSFHTDEKAMLDMDGLEPEMTVTVAEYEAAGSMARIIEGKIVIGKTEAEKAEEEKQAKVEACKAELSAIDREAGAGRAVRALALEAAKRNGIEGEDFDRLREFEDRAERQRAEIGKLG
jgi:hypothetical protein